MTRAPRALVVAVLVLAAAVLGCGSGGSQSSLARGREIFRNGTSGNLACAFCHTLRSAGAVGPFGPDLDNIVFDEFRKRGAPAAEIRRFVLDTLAHPECSDPTDPSRCMPKGLASGRDAQAVASFIARCAGVAGRSGTPQTAGCRRADGLPVVHGQAAEGERLYVARGCISCHSLNGNTVAAPTFKGLAGRRVELVDGTAVTADNAYIVTSILAPDAQVVRGFRRGEMSTRIPPGTVPARDATALAAFIEALR